MPDLLPGHAQALGSPPPALLAVLPEWWSWVHAAVIVSVMAAAFLAVVLLVTADRWLVAAITKLDTFLTRMGFGTWMAGFITRLEMKNAERKRRRGASEGADGHGPSGPGGPEG